MNEYRIGFADGIMFAIVLCGTAIALTILFLPKPQVFAVVAPESVKPQPQETTTDSE